MAPDKLSNSCLAYTITTQQHEVNSLCLVTLGRVDSGLTTQHKAPFKKLSIWKSGKKMRISQTTPQRDDNKVFQLPGGKKNSWGKKKKQISLQN